MNTKISPEARECLREILKYHFVTPLSAERKLKHLEQILKNFEDKANAPLVSDIEALRISCEHTSQAYQECSLKAEKLEQENTRLKESISSLTKLVESKRKLIDEQNNSLESWIESAANKINALEESIRVKDEALRPFANRFEGNLENVGSGTFVSPSFQAKVFKDAKEALSHNTGRKEI